jgi:VanZ family protein
VSRRLLLLGLFVTAAAALLFVPLPIPPTYAGRTIENAGHMPLFFVGTLFILSLLRHEFDLEGTRLYAYAGLVGTAAGILSEFLQWPLRRDASWEDVLADCVGVVCALAAHAAVTRREILSGAARATAALIALGCLATYVTPIINMVRAYAHRNAQFPVLASFDSRIELAWIVGYGIRRDVIGGVLEVEFVRRVFPGFSFYEPVQDWRRYQTLVVDAENPEAAEVLHLGVRVHDTAHSREYADRFNRIFDLAPGERRTLRVPLDDILRAPRNRLMNMTQISDVTLFRTKEGGSQRLRLHGMRLE